MSTTTITVPTEAIASRWDSATTAKCVAVLATQAAADVNAIYTSIDSTTSGANFSGVRYVRGVVTSAQTLATFTSVTAGTIVDGVTYVAGDRVLLVGQATKSQNGIYVVGTVSAGSAPLTRPTDFATGSVLAAGCMVEVSEGTLFAGSTWKITTAGAITVGTTSFDMYPRQVVQSVVLVAGTKTLATVPLLSATKTAVLINRTVANTCTLTVGGYHPTVGGANGITPGIVGTASLVIEACVGAGTISASDVSTVAVTIVNF